MRDRKEGKKKENKQESGVEEGRKGEGGGGKEGFMGAENPCNRCGWQKTIHNKESENFHSPKLWTSEFSHSSVLAVEVLLVSSWVFVLVS